jgi:hypothetical protein
MSAADALSPGDLELPPRAEGDDGWALRFDIDRMGWLSIYRGPDLVVTFTRAELLQLAGYFGALDGQGAHRPAAVWEPEISPVGAPADTAPPSNVGGRA